MRYTKVAAVPSTSQPVFHVKTGRDSVPGSAQRGGSQCNTEAMLTRGKDLWRITPRVGKTGGRSERRGQNHREKATTKFSRLSITGKRNKENSKTFNTREGGGKKVDSWERHNDSSPNHGESLSNPVGVSLLWRGGGRCQKFKKIQRRAERPCKEKAKEERRGWGKERFGRGTSQTIQRQAGGNPLHRQRERMTRQERSRGARGTGGQPSPRGRKVNRKANLENA